ncbi:glycerol-3-phosphate 1-O-acyltransferase PlsY [Evansella sp. LMS18]|jgi:glycerol-3-phosphate acyltransferase PlsY|uniref:glycerol-3-phosphate 1-O-acyltransferase PlsY n=1 Tax=Evansella sp. LMS18 TaxID=2924033 RepID=UPI0020D0686F|nr:glycerol-3-phosphate 1-O-acyltransferase PlsY [Evansella sp. LMS18]UTR09609.1 glycerol-3-phosphate 1-O-acyltransferase PlsY [Evansella sp. LMS18]
MTAVISIIISYLIGAISFSYLLAKKLKKVDIRQHGSGNAGATNTLRVLGVGPAIAVLLLDCLKGVAAVLLGFWLTGEGMVAAACGIAAIAGHNWPVYFGFRGGKGVATTIGVLATLVFFAALIAGIIAIISIVITRYVSLGSLIFIVLTTVITFFFHGFFDYPAYLSYFILFIALLTLWRHRTNIKRLFQGTESKIGEKAT